MPTTPTDTARRCDVCGEEFLCSDGVFEGTECAAPMTFYCWPCFKQKNDAERTATTQSRLLKDQDPASPYWPYG